MKIKYKTYNNNKFYTHTHLYIYMSSPIYHKVTSIILTYFKCLSNLTHAEYMSFEPKNIFTSKGTMAAYL